MTGRPHLPWHERTAVRRVSLFHARRFVLLTGMVLVVAGLLAATAQQAVPDASVGSPGILGQGRPGGGAMEPPPLSPTVEAQMAREREHLRQKELVDDTDKLLALAQRLHDEVAKSRSDQLSVSVVKTSEQIEKLAKNVKDRMRGY